MDAAGRMEHEVPSREGTYGDKVLAIEPGGIEFIPEHERHGIARRLFWTWTSPNLEFATIYVGVLPIAIFGGGFWLTVLGLVIGNALGALTVGLTSSLGPKFGVPQLVQSRGAFGYLGNLLPAGLNAITASFGWFTVNSVSGAFALMTLCRLISVPVPDFKLAFALIVVAQVAVAFLGHNLIHQFEKVVLPFLAIVFGLCALIILARAVPSTGFNPKAPVAFGGPVGAFSLAIFVAYGYAASWSTFGSDYSRYLPQRSTSGSVVLWASLGVFVSCVVLEIAGAGLATVAGTAWGPKDIPTAQFIMPLPHLLAILAMVAIAIGAVAANVINIYSGSMSFLTLGIKIGLKWRRAVVGLTCGVIGLLIGFALQAEVGPGSKYEDFLLLITYWIAPFLAVVLIDYVLRRGDYGDGLIFYSSSHRAWKGLAAMLIGLAASTPFWNQTLYVGWVALHYPQLGDFSFVVGFLVAAVAYTLLSRVAGRPAAQS